MHQPPTRLPLWLIAGDDHFDHVKKKQEITPDTAWMGVTIDGVRCLPLFTDTDELQRFVAENANTITGGSMAVACYGKELLSMLEVFKPDGIVINPHPSVGTDDVLDKNIFATWLRGEAERKR